jgi:Amt family ammonium transporter
MSTLAYFFIGYGVAYGVDFLHRRPRLAAMAGGETYGPQGLSLIKFFFLLTFAAAIPAIISGGIAERAKFGPQLAASAIIVALVYPFFEGMVWNGNFGFQAWLEASFGASIP